MVVMSYLDNLGRYVTIKGPDFESFESEIDAVKSTIPERILAIARGFSENEQKKY